MTRQIDPLTGEVVVSLIDSHEAAARLGLSVKTLKILVKRYDLDRYTLPGRRRVYYNIDEIDMLATPQLLVGRGRP